MKKVLITGASGGIGLEICKLFYENGWKVYGYCATAVGLKKLKRRFPKGDFFVINFNINYPKKININIDVVINNAAVKYNINETFEVNIRTPYNFMNMCPKSKFINIISDIINIDHPNLPEYKASKHALDGMSKSFRAQGMNVSCVYPGLTKTKFNKRKGGMNPKRVAEAIWFAANCPQNVDLFIYDKVTK